MPPRLYLRGTLLSLPETGRRHGNRAPDRRHPRRSSPKFSPSAEGFEHDIDWLSRLVQRFGSVTVLDPCSPRFRERRRLAPPQDVTAKLSRGGKYPVYSGDLGQIETIELDAESESGSESESEQKRRPLTFVRGPELELKEAYRRLQANEVVTFKVPFLRVQAGDVVGVIGRQSHLGRGFLHWEVLTPGEGSMKDLIGFLNGRLPEDARRRSERSPTIRQALPPMSSSGSRPLAHRRPSYARSASVTSSRPCRPWCSWRTYATSCSAKFVERARRARSRTTLLCLFPRGSGEARRVRHRRPWVIGLVGDEPPVSFGL